MNKTEAMRELKAMGTAQNRKVYARHGIGAAMFGVSYGNMGKLKKKIKVDHDLALKLWATGNHDARILATMIADPAQLKAATLDAWVKDLDNYVLADAFSALAAKSPLAAKRSAKWLGARNEWAAATGWNLVSYATGDDGVSDADFAARVQEIEKTIHGAKNRVRHAMNQALISIGIRNAKLRKVAVAAAKRIGKVEVDHGETGCKTPDAAAYIQKTLAYRKKQAANRAAKKKSAAGRQEARKVTAVRKKKASRR